jgi:hypothetical protein
LIACYGEHTGLPPQPSDASLVDLDALAAGHEQEAAA